MAVIALSLFGSRARGDNNSNSDVDLLAVVDDNTMKSKSISKSNFAFYPIAFIENMFKSGDLFALHLKMESITIYDPTKVMDRLKNSFMYKSTYYNERNNAIDAGYLLIRMLKNGRDIHDINKKLSWCVRTILIAESAELRAPKFSIDSLAAENEEIRALIRIKDSPRPETHIIPTFEKFITQINERSSALIPNDADDLIEYFKLNNNTMALKILGYNRRITSPY
ncbi:nucleotidyltransferase domain-containing protein [Siculibacillus lacustris]|uniref:Nucleotidyltransferase domain-containing protein n=1 Tax=Siculibacillus lacustris TaxID=1549641 RepID=A0A4Q9VE79_9HYPH|nr:nucleotidyltransferase domain-containing protein [Siculibacillus lacustris]TBW33074.1 nucleotidyltransferase domain-containing protein [Siculibacillus lacustris]